MKFHSRILIVLVGFLFVAQARSQTWNFYNEANEDIRSIGMWNQASGFMAGDWGLPSIPNGGGPVTLQSSNFASIYCTPVCSGNVQCVSYVNGQGPWPNQYWGGGPGMTYNVVFVQQNTTPSDPHTPVPKNYTNSGCITIVNNTTSPQYYQFQATGGSGNQTFSGCSGGLTVNGNQGSAAYGDGNEWLAVYPGETIQVCCTISDGTNNNPRTLLALQALAAFQPCGLSGIDLGGGGARCVNLCNDGIEISGNGVPTISDPMAQSTSPNNATGNPANPGLTTGGQQPSGTNGIQWPDGPTNQNGLMMDITGRTGFAALNQDIIGVGTITANGLNALQQQETLNTLGLEATIRSNAANVVISNLVVSNLFGSNGLSSVGITNLPTNYNSSVANGWLGAIATNTARTNGFDTNLEATANSIASNTAAPLAYTNVGISAYSTNPSDTVSYASNTLAAPISISLQGYSETASSAAQAVTVGGSPGSLLEIHFDLPGVGSYTIDCNPMDNSDVADFASWFRSTMEWVVGIGFIGLVLRDGGKATQSALQAPQGQFPKITVLGNSIGWPLAAVYIVAIVAAVAAVPFAIVTWFSVGQTGQMWWQQIALNPFSGSGAGRAVSLSLWLADQFMPMSYMVSSMLYYIAFRFALSGIVSVAAIIVRALMA